MTRRGQAEAISTRESRGHSYPSSLTPHLLVPSLCRPFLSLQRYRPSKAKGTSFSRLHIDPSARRLSARESVALAQYAKRFAKRCSVSRLTSPFAQSEPQPLRPSIT